MDSPHLLPCPSCDGGVRVETWNEPTFGSRSRVTCTACGLTTGWVRNALTPDTSAAWTVWQELPRREAKPATPQHEWEPPHHTAVDQSWRCLRCGCRTYRPQEALPCPALSSCAGTSLPPLHDPALMSIPHVLSEEIVELNNAVVQLNAHVRALEARHG